MAKGKSKSKAVRQYLEKHPDADTQTVVSELAVRSIKVSPQLVYTIRSALKREKKLPQKARKPRRRAAQRQVVTEPGLQGVGDMLLKARDFVAACQGMDRARRILELYGKLVEPK